MLEPLPEGLAPPPVGNLGSAPGNLTVYSVNLQHSPF